MRLILAACACLVLLRAQHVTFTPAPWSGYCSGSILQLVKLTPRVFHTGRASYSSYVWGYPSPHYHMLPSARDLFPVLAGRQ